MSKIIALPTTSQRRVTLNLIKTAQKSNNYVLPPINRDAFCRDRIDSKNMLKTQRMNTDKIIIPSLKLSDCSKIQIQRYANLISCQLNEKTMVRPWAAKSRKCSKENRPQITKITKLGKKEASKGRSFSKIQKTDLQSMNMLQFESEPSKNSKYQETFEIQPNKGSLTDRDRKFSCRDRMNSCRVATKKAGFPFNKKQYQDFKLNEHFQREEQKLSTIPNNTEDEQQKFISFDSFTELVF